MKRLPVERVLWATALIILGLLLFAQNFNLIEQNIWDYAWKFWPLFFMIPAVAAVFRGRIYWGSLITLFGAAIIYSNFTGFNVWGTIWPVFIILLGISMIFKPARLDNMVKKDDYKENYIDETVVFAGLERKVVSKSFKGGKVDTIFGGAKLDLRNIELGEDKVTFEVTAVFGGCEVLVDTQKYKVVAEGTGIFGGWETKYEPSTKEKPVLVITGTAIFGGVEVRN